jgi:hypothetical protein
MTDLTQLICLGHTAHRCSGIVEQLLLLLTRHQAKQGARLAVIVIADAVIVAVGSTRDRQWRLFELRIFDGAAKAVGLVVRGTAAIVESLAGRLAGGRRSGQEWRS